LRPENSIGEPFVQLNKVGSTNNYAMAQAQARLAEHGATWFAHEQTAGKGQRDKSWITEPGQNIIMSLVIQPQAFPIYRQFELSAVTALACRDLFSSYALSSTKIKWPNDLYWEDRKAGGILIQNILQGNEWKYAIVGIGMNINQVDFPANIRNPVSLTHITGKTFNTVFLARELCAHLDRRWKQLISSQPGDILKEYQANLYKLEEMVTLKMNSDTFTATIKGVTGNGDLVVKTNIEQVIPFGQVEWILT